MSKESLFTTVRIADLRLILGLLFVTVGVSAVIFAFLDYHSMVGNRLPSLNPVSDLKTDISAIPPGAVLAQKCARPGIVKCLGFDSPSDLHYTWPAATVCDTVFKGQKNQYFGRNRQGWGNTVAAVQNGQCVFPEIDAETVHSGAGSLKITIPSNSSADSGGQFMEVFKRDGDGSPDGTYVGPGSPLGSVLYFQFYQRFDDSFLSTDFRCLDGECGGWKQAIWFGNPPKGNSASSLEVTITNGWQRGVPQMYGQIGRDDYGIQDVRGCKYNRGANHAGSGFESHVNYPEPLCVPYKADHWMEFTGRIEIRGQSNEPSSRVQLWVDGQLAVDYSDARIDWSGTSGDGFGQFLLSPYHTKKDDSQLHPAGHVWYDDLIISTQPILMNDAVAATSETDVNPVHPVVVNRSN